MHQPAALHDRASIVLSAPLPLMAARPGTCRGRPQTPRVWLTTRATPSPGSPAATQSPWDAQDSALSVGKLAAGITKPGIRCGSFQAPLTSRTENACDRLPFPVRVVYQPPMVQFACDPHDRDVANAKPRGARAATPGTRCALPQPPLLVALASVACRAPAIASSPRHALATAISTAGSRLMEATSDAGRAGLTVVGGAALYNASTGDNRKSAINHQRRDQLLVTCLMSGRFQPRSPPATQRRLRGRPRPGQL